MDLAKAAVNGNIEEIKRILEQHLDGASLSSDFVASFKIAAHKEYALIAELLVRKDGMPLDDVDDSGRTPLS
jgi:hypothetical protein